MRRGFTLVELLVVIAIISILAALLLPALSRAVESARQTACINRQKQASIVLGIYADAYGDFLPRSYSTSPYQTQRSSGYAGNWGALLMDLGYVDRDVTQGTPEVLHCPSVKYRRTGWPGRSSYGMRKDILGDNTWRQHIKRSSVCRSALPPQTSPSAYPVGACSLQAAPKVCTWEWDECPHYQEGFSLGANFGNCYDALVYRVHSDRASVWFLDGHGKSLGDHELKGLVIRSGYEGNAVVDNQDDDFENSWPCPYY